MCPKQLPIEERTSPGENCVWLFLKENSAQKLANACQCLCEGEGWMEWTQVQIEMLLNVRRSERFLDFRSIDCSRFSFNCSTNTLFQPVSGFHLILKWVSLVFVLLRPHEIRLNFVKCCCGCDCVTFSIFFVKALKSKVILMQVELA